MKYLISEFLLAHPIKKFAILLWISCFIGGMIFSVFYLAENGISQTFETFFGTGVNFKTVSIFLCIFIFRTLFFIPVSVLMIASPFIFGGFWIGLLMSGIGEIVGAIVGFFAARYYGQELFQGYKNENKMLQIVNEKMEQFGGVAVGILRLTPVTFDFINFGAGLSTMRFSVYFLSTFVSVWPDCMLYVSLGSAVDSPISIIYSAVSVVGVLFLFRYLRTHPRYKKIFIMRLNSAKKQIGSLLSKMDKLKRRKKGRGKK